MVTRRRERQWFTSRTSQLSIASAGLSDIQLYNATIHGPRFMKGATVLRLILDLTLRATAVAQEVELYWGVLIANEDARVAGALPDPRDDSDRPDYMVRGRMVTIQSSLSDSSQWDHRLMDIRSGRTLRSEEDGLLMVLEAGSTGFTLEVSLFIRVLMLLP